MSELLYLDFDLQIEELGDGAYHAHVLDSPVGQAEATFTLPFSALEIENFFLRIGRPRRGVRRAHSPEIQEARRFGSKLFDAVFQGELQRCLLRSIDQAEQQEQGIRLRLRLAPSLIELPWEYLYDTSRQRFLVHSTTTPIVRYLDLPQSDKPLTITPPLKVLVMIANPDDVEGLDVEAEWQKIKTAVATAEQRGLLQVTRLPPEKQRGATLAALQKQLRQEKYHIFHFIGHGTFDQQTQDGVLLLEAEDGRSRLVSGNYLGTLLHDESSLRLAILNACEGARTTQSDPFAGVAQQLVRQGIPAVIAMQFEITDGAAIQLAREFYDALGSGYPVDAALAEARKALFTAGNDIEWGTPVLYLRADDGRLFDVAPPPTDAAALVNKPDKKEQPTDDAAVVDAPALTRKQPLWQQQRVMVLLLAALLFIVSAVALWQFITSRQPAASTTQSLTPSEAASPPTTVAAAEASQSPANAPPIAGVDPISRTIWLKEAEDAWNAGDGATAKEIYGRLLTANAQDVDALVGMAGALRTIGDNNAALRTLNQAATLAPDDPEVHFALGSLYYDIYANNSLAIDHLTRALAKSIPAQKRRIYSLRADVYKSQGEYAKAIADMDEVIRRDGYGDHYVQRAQIYQAAGEEALAERDFTAAIALAPTEGYFYYARAGFYTNGGQVAKAVADYRAFLTYADPLSNPEAFANATRYVAEHDAPSTPSPAVTPTPAA